MYLGDDIFKLCSIGCNFQWLGPFVGWLVLTYLLNPHLQSSLNEQHDGISEKFSFLTENCALLVLCILTLQSYFIIWHALYSAAYSFNLFKKEDSG